MLHCSRFFYLHPLLLLLCISLLIPGCSTYKIIQPSPVEKINFLHHAKTQQDGQLKVRASILNAKESYAAFGLPLKLAGIQAIWVSVENSDDRAYWLLYPAIDPDHFSPDEVAYAFSSAMSDEDNDLWMQQLRDQAFKNPVLPGETQSGFVFVNLDEGHKEIDIELLGHQKLVTFNFFFTIPGLNYQNLFEVENKHIEKKADLNEVSLKQMLENLPCCTSSADGINQGDPLNLVFIGNADDLFPAFVRRGWHAAENNYLESVKKTAFSFLFGEHYRYSPVSPLYAFGRKQDIALQKARGTIHQRNHLRLWLTPFTYQDQEVWIGQISRDIGVRFTNKTPILVTHKIDPDIDEARNELIQEMLFSQGLVKIGYVSGIPVSTPEAPAYNLTGDPYFNDGLRAVILMSKKKTPIREVQFFNWDYSKPTARHLHDETNQDTP